MSFRYVIACLCLATALAACGKKTEERKTDPGPWVNVPKSESSGPAVDALKPVPRMDAVRAYATANELIAACKAATDDIRARLSALETHTGAPDLQTVYKPYNEMTLQLANGWQETNLLQEVHPQKEIRDAGDGCDQAYSRLATDISLSRPLYELIAKIDTSSSDPATQFSVFKTLRDFRRAGVDKDEATRARIRELKDEETKASQAFGRVVRDDVRRITITEKGLTGLPQDYVNAHKPDAEGKITISTDYPDYFPFMSYATDDAARKALRIASRDRGFPDNEANLKALLAKRYEMARLLGYPDYAAYITEDKMVATPDQVQGFIDQIDAIVKVAVERDKAVLLARLKENDPKASQLGAWQYSYLQELVRKEQYAIDSKILRTYFPFDKVKAGILKLTEDQFGLTIRDWQTPVWDPSVTAHEVYEGDKLIGRFYLDLHPRTGKYKHAAEFPLAMGIEGEQIPIAALVTNFPGGDDAGALMEHDDVLTFLHEFGHLLHHLLGGHVAWVNNSGISTEDDFVEAPSQLLENWAYDYETLERFAVNEKGETIPEELVKQLNRARFFGLGIDTATQVFYAALSLDYYRHDPASFELLPEMVKVENRYAPFPYMEGTHFYAGFQHLDEYSAMYYTYQWSLAIAQDMFTKFETDGLNPQTTLAYRKAVLDPGGSAPAAELVQSFLGRPWSTEAYREWLNRTE